MSMTPLAHVLFLLAGTATFVAHMMPSVLAVHRDHPQKFTIFAVNLIPGFGWVAGFALLMSSQHSLERVYSD